MVSEIGHDARAASQETSFHISQPRPKMAQRITPSRARPRSPREPGIKRKSGWERRLRGDGRRRMSAAAAEFAQEAVGLGEFEVEDGAVEALVLGIELLERGPAGLKEGIEVLALGLLLGGEEALDDVAGLRVQRAEVALEEGELGGALAGGELLGAIEGAELGLGVLLEGGEFGLVAVVLGGEGARGGEDEVERQKELFHTWRGGEDGC